MINYPPLGIFLSSKHSFSKVIQYNLSSKNTILNALASHLVRMVHIFKRSYPDFYHFPSFTCYFPLYTTWGLFKSWKIKIITIVCVFLKSPQHPTKWYSLGIMQVMEENSHMEVSPPVQMPLRLQQQQQRKRTSLLYGCSLKSVPSQIKITFQASKNGNTLGSSQFKMPNFCTSTRTCYCSCTLLSVFPNNTRCRQ